MKSIRLNAIEAHKLINKLSTIIGNCDLALEKTQTGTEHEKRLATIREAADAAVKELVEHQHQVESRKVTRRKAS